jgi:hypothetical protein
VADVNLTQFRIYFRQLDQQPMTPGRQRDAEYGGVPLPRAQNEGGGCNPVGDRQRALRSSEQNWPHQRLMDDVKPPPFSVHLQFLAL